jgi:hypothetical protein
MGRRNRSERPAIGDLCQRVRAFRFWRFCVGPGRRRPAFEQVVAAIAAPEADNGGIARIGASLLRPPR